MTLLHIPTPASMEEVVHTRGGDVKIVVTGGDKKESQLVKELDELV